MKVPVSRAGEGVRQVRAFLESQGYAVDDSEHPIQVYDAPAEGRVYVRAQHGGTHSGRMAFAGLWTALSRNSPPSWGAERAYWENQTLADVFVVRLPQADPENEHRG